MSGRESKKKSKRRHRDRGYGEDDAEFSRGSGVDYSKVADRHVDDDRYEKLKTSGGPGSGSNAVGDDGGGGPAALHPSLGTSVTTAGGGQQQQPKVSAQMAAVMRIMTGQEERTIAQKLADSNRPTWEQYKKDNEDKLDISGVDQKKMDAYRKELDEQRDKLLTRGSNHQKDGREKKSKKKKKKRKKDDSDSSNSENDESSNDEKKHKRKKHRKRSDKKHSRKKRSRRYYSDSDSSDDSRRQSSKRKRKRSKDRKKCDDGSSSGDSYRLSSFFAKGSDSESK